MKRLFFLLIVCCILNEAYAQTRNNDVNLKLREQKLKKLKGIDYFSYDYKNLDDNFSPKMSSRDFQNTVTKYKFIKHKIKTRRDSVGVCLMAEFEDWDKARIANLRLSYSITRLGYHLWLSKQEVIDLKRVLKIKHNYQLKEFFLNNERSPIVKRVSSDLKRKLINHNLKNIPKNDLNSLMNFAMLNHPTRIKEYQKLVYLKKHGRKPHSSDVLGVGCGKKNCCQL